MNPDAIRPTLNGELRHVAGRSGVLWLLGIAVVATCAGMTAATFRGDGASINAFLFLEGGMSHGAAARLERAAMTTILMLSIVALFRPVWPVLLPVAGYILAEALAGWHQRGYPFSEWALTALAPRYLTPLAIILLFRASLQPDHTGGWRQAAGEWGLRIGLATVFAVHGLEALRLHPWFVDFIISSGINLFDVRVSEATASMLLRIIGIADLLVAIALVLRAPAAAVLMWAAFWGAVTALSRMTANGWGAYPEVLARATHVLVPLALWLILKAKAQRSTGFVRPTGGASRVVAP